MGGTSDDCILQYVVCWWIPEEKRLFVFQLKDPSSHRYEVELPADVVRGQTDSQDVLYTTEYQSDPFGFIVRRNTNERVMWVSLSCLIIFLWLFLLWKWEVWPILKSFLSSCWSCLAWLSVSFLSSMNTTVAPLLFADQYLQLSTRLSSHLVSGLGQHYSSLFLDLNWTTLTLWNRDMAPHVSPELWETETVCSGWLTWSASLFFIFWFRLMLIFMAPIHSTSYRKGMGWHTAFSFSTATQLVPTDAEASRIKEWSNECW